ncbi:MAG: hypothetical protein ACU837_02040 [Gammaproteobacteria bacterium]
MPFPEPRYGFAASRLARSGAEFNYRYFDACSAQVFVGLSTRGLETDRALLLDVLRQQVLTGKVDR